MKYVDVIDLDQHFDPVFKLADDDKSAAWATFIPTVGPFEELLRESLETFESQTPKAQRPIWIQGTYGTGKSHATSVVSHLLDDDVTDLEPFLARMKPELSAHVRSFRQRRRIMPVYLYGSGAPLVHSARTFDLAVQTAVKAALVAHGLNANVPDDFDRYVDLVEKNPLKMNWDEVIRQDDALRAYASTGTAELLLRLKKQDRDVLAAVEDYFAENGNAFLGTASLNTWLRQVLESALPDGGPYTGVMIYWDEFTSVLELTRARDIAAALQRLAEFCQSEPRLKLLIISHRKPGQLALDADEQKKIDDRFKVVDYHMTDVTTYRILSAAILRKDVGAYNRLVSAAYTAHGELDALVSRLEAGGAEGMSEDIRGLFPIHPYTAYLATLISRRIGSSDRSIFMFLHDAEHGFKKFISENPATDGQVWLTPDVLWDYFAPSLAIDEPDEFLTVNTVYNQRRAAVAAKGTRCTMTFKGVLLLNFLRTYLGSSNDLEMSLLEPTLDNCEAMFAGSELQDHVKEELQFLEEQGMLQHMGAEYLVMHGATLPEEEVHGAIEQLQTLGEGDLVTLLGDQERRDLESRFLGSSVLREAEIRFFTGGQRAASFHKKSAEQLGFRNPAALHIATILYARDDDVAGASESLLEYSRRAVSVDPALIILEACSPLGSNKMREWVSHRAHAVVAERHSLASVKVDYDKMADSIVSNWVSQLANSSRYNLYVEGKVVPIGCSVLPTTLQDCAEQVFKNGFDEVRGIPKTCWHGGGNAVAERVLQAESLDDLVTKLAGQQKQVLGIFKSQSGSTYVVNQDLELLESAAREPIGRLSQYVQMTLDPMTRRVTSFNLGDLLQDLALAPFGLYENLVHSAALAFVLRPYVGRLYDGNGRRIGVLSMRDVVKNLFKFWSESKAHELLDVQFGTETEEKLVQILKTIFNLPDVGTLMDARGQLRTWADHRHRPLWSAKYVSGASMESNTAVDALCQLLQMTQEDVSETEMQRFVSVIDRASADLKTLLTKENLESGFAQWPATFTNSQLSGDELARLYEELSRRMAASPSMWQEEVAREKALEILKTCSSDEYASMAAQKVSDILDLSSTDDLAAAQQMARRAVRARKYPIFAAAAMAQEPALQAAISAFQAFVSAETVDGMSSKALVDVLDRAGVDLVRQALAPQAVESAFGGWAARQLGETPSSVVTEGCYHALLVDTVDPSLCSEPEACEVLTQSRSKIAPPEDFKEKIRERIMMQPATEAHRLLVAMAERTVNGWTELERLLDEECDG